MSEIGKAPHTLVITNDFPPRDGGIQTFVFELVNRFDPTTVTVLASDYDGAHEFDSTLNFRVVRADTRTLLPTKTTRNLARQIVVETGSTRVVYGAAAPLGLLSKHLRAVGVTRIVGITHGHEAGWAITPITRQLLKVIGDGADVLTYLGEYTRGKIGTALSSSSVKAMRQLAPAVDSEVFHPRNRATAEAFREVHGLSQSKVIVCVSRLMERKGQDTLIKALPQILVEVPDAHLVIVGGGSYEPKLRALVNSVGVDASVTFTGKVPYEDLPAWYAIGDVFAMPCRTRNAGWDVEGLGIVFLEASATGLPVIAGDSGGAPDAVQHGTTGFVVDGTNVDELATTIMQVLTDAELAAQLGANGREWVLREWTWERSVTRLQKLLAGSDPDA